jgi:hypothetical protein
MGLVWLCVFWNMLVPCATYGFESNRARFTTLALFTMLLWYVMQNAWRRYAQRSGSSQT